MESFDDEKLTYDALQGTYDWVCERINPEVIPKLEALMRLSFEMGKISHEKELKYNRKIYEEGKRIARK